MKKIILLALTLFASAVFAAEKDYQEKWCEEHGGVIPGRIQDGTYPDCITDTHAIEFDYGYKWEESIGQSLNYAMHTGKRAGVVLIIRDSKGASDRNGLKRFNAVLGHYGSIPVELVDVLDESYLE